ncbi:MAG: nickel-type superoxide dismutase maturation protease [Frankiales bacterium]|nr:nickel-type superoxide dismutase maturation protease [Frankiales bacterium]
MTPTLLPGDRVLVRHGARVRPGAVVLGTFRSRPELIVIKRVGSGSDGAWWLVSDNPRAGSDSSVYGTADVQAVARFVLPRRAAPSHGLRWLSAEPGPAEFE